MLISFNATKEITAPGMNNGTGMMTIRMYMDKKGKMSRDQLTPVALLDMTQEMILTLFYPVMEKHRKLAIYVKRFRTQH